MNRRAMVWRSIKQGCIEDSIVEVEYVTTCEATKEAIWLGSSYMIWKLFQVRACSSLKTMTTVEQ
ncbi:gag/pol protein [Cucumis melo var. makuwa]|uniref:Gag/pol protein n=1 Tax=Cucumis melo var. makuwa TaxID=1194695 RepID=A0A5A7VCU2_CUCMM|nr:gag/pol protein [Cucumis melo var. makuwa]